MIVNLTWRASADSTVTGYNVYRGISAGGPYIQIAANVRQNYFIDKPDYGDWFYVIAAKNCCTEGVYSAEIAVTATTPPVPPTSLIAVLGSCGTSQIQPGGSGYGVGGYGEGGYGGGI